MSEKTYTVEEQAENRRKWVEALRSGGYQQCREAMARGVGYCCLGVAATVVLGVEPKAVSDPVDDEINDDLYAKVDKSLGLTAEKRCCLACLNDDARLTFPEIADHVESHPELFEGASK